MRISTGMGTSMSPKELTDCSKEGQMEYHTPLVTEGTAASIGPLKTTDWEVFLLRSNLSGKRAHVRECARQPLLLAAHVIA